ncbi:hypothetical protein IV203_006384 [Nitzschia inconspicua]|uniref:Uncharacterized protein n=1 Tax=Nitzschia inconspicua TaxID=303405 RepID=A0A9K3KAH0_9STRA|nr:hypothetical protein IV203_006591 [Nitzschia inconspicua]KAG7339981.1 hypothetical protein IV203_006384 [Nitzschia inconspicua]
MNKFVKAIALAAFVGPVLTISFLRESAILQQIHSVQSSHFDGDNNNNSNNNNNNQNENNAIWPEQLFYEPSDEIQSERIMNRHTTTDSKQSPVEVKIVIHPWNEMGNQLFYTIMAKCIQWKLQERNIPSQIVMVRNIRQKKLHYVTDTLQRCFPVVYHPQSIQWVRQRDLAQDRSNKNTVSVELKVENQESLDGIQGKIRKIQTIVNKAINERNDSSPKPTDRIIVELHVWSFFVPWPWIEEYHNALQTDFAIHRNCCDPTSVPQSNEHVYHYRNFIHEMNRKRKDYRQMGWHELTPRQAAVDLFGYLKESSTVLKPSTVSQSVSNETQLITVVSRYDSIESMAQVQALQKEGFSSRLRPHNIDSSNSHSTDTTDSLLSSSSMHDFCYLLQATGDIAGMARSTYFKFASLFGRSRTSWWIVVDTPQGRHKLGDWWDFSHNWTHPVLKRRIQHRIFLPEKE